MRITMTVGADHVEQKRPKDHAESQEVVENNEGHDKKGETRNSNHVGPRTDYSIFRKV